MYPARLAAHQNLASAGIQDVPDRQVHPARPETSVSDASVCARPEPSAAVVPEHHRVPADVAVQRSAGRAEFQATDSQARHTPAAAPSGASPRGVPEQPVPQASPPQQVLPEQQSRVRPQL